MEWQPIESAPRDGSYILGFDQSSRWPDDVEESMWIVRWREQHGWTISMDGQRVEITHWMPLPSPPPVDGV